MNKEDLRGKYIKAIPKMIISGEQLSYADWLENLIVTNYVVNKNDLLQRVTDTVCNCPPIVAIMNKEGNCKNCGKTLFKQ